MATASSPVPAACLRCGAAAPASGQPCPVCWEQRHRARGMSPRGFRLFTALWFGWSAVLLALAGRAALQPWTAHGAPPAYAYRLLGSGQPPTPPQCRVDVADTAGLVRSTRLVPCDAAAVQAGGTPGDAGATADSEQRRWAALLHGSLCLGGALCISWLSLRGLRRLFRGRTQPVWVPRSATPATPREP